MKLSRLLQALFILISIILLPAKDICAREGNELQPVFFFQGNTALSEKELRDAAHYELQSLETGAYRQSAVDDAAFMMELAYRNAGYPEAHVSYSLIDQGEREKHVVFAVQEGPKILVSEVILEGADQLGSSLQATIIKKPPFPYIKKQLESFSSDIAGVYAGEGFIDAAVQPPRVFFHAGENLATVTISIKEGVRYTVGAISFAGDVSREQHDILQKVSSDLSGKTYYYRQKLLLKSKVTEIYGNLGFSDAEIDVEADRHEEEGVVDLNVRIQSGTLCLINDVVVKGNIRTGRKFIMDRMRLLPGNAYSLTARRDSFRNLYQSGLFSRIDIALADTETAGKKDVIVELEEKPAQQLYVEPGWGSYELLRLKAGYRDSNLFASGKVFRMDTGMSVKGRSVEAGFIDPWLFGTSVTGDIPFHYRYREEPGFTLENSGVGFYLSKKFPQKVFANIGYEYSSNLISDIDLEAGAFSSEDNYNKASVIMQVIRDTRNDLFFPSSGYRGYASVEVSTPFLGSELSYMRLTGGARYFHSLGKSLILGLRYSTGILFPYGNQEGIPLGERFYNGGENSVRSFSESSLGPVDKGGEPLGGAAFNIFNIELRKKFTSNLAGSLFIDLGNISPNSSELLDDATLATDNSALTRATLSDYFRDMRPALGCGVQYLLPVGPARLDFAWNPDRDNDRDEDSFSVHFSIGMAF